jgi:putative membrane protein
LVVQIRARGPRGAEPIEEQGAHAPGANHEALSSQPSGEFEIDPVSEKLDGRADANGVARARCTASTEPTATRPNKEIPVPMKNPEDHRNRNHAGAAAIRSGALDRYAFLKRRRLAAASVCIALILSLVAGAEVARAQNSGASAATSTASALTPVDYNFVAEANLGAPFQIDSGRIAETKATTAAIRDYAHLMVTSHIPVVEALNKILERRDIKAPPNTLLDGAYHAMIASLKAEHATALDRDYVEGQVEYQRGNAALFRYEITNGTDPDLKEFARATLPKIEDHLERALRLAKDIKLGKTASE